MPTLKKRSKKFDEEVAPELVNVTEAKLKNLRYKRFPPEQQNQNDQEESIEVITI